MTLPHISSSSYYSSIIFFHIRSAYTSRSAGKRRETCPENSSLNFMKLTHFLKQISLNLLISLKSPPFFHSRISLSPWSVAKLFRGMLPRYFGRGSESPTRADGIHRKCGRRFAVPHACLSRILKADQTRPRAHLCGWNGALQLVVLSRSHHSGYTHDVDALDRRKSRNCTRRARSLYSVP